MQFLAQVNQKEALEKGINATSSTAKIELDPAALTPDERRILAACLERDGFTLDWPLKVSDPSPAGLLAQIRERLAQEVEDAEKRRREDEASALRRAEETAAAERWLAAPAPAEPHLVTRDAGGGPSRPGVVQAAGEITDDRYPFAHWLLPPEIAARVDAESGVRRDRRQSEIAALEREAEARYAEWSAPRRAARDALYARLPEVLRLRDRDGYAAEGEVSKALAVLVREDAGFPPWTGWRRSAEVSVLTDAEYLALQVLLLRGLPAGADHEVRDVWDGGEPLPCEEHEDCEEDCEECGTEHAERRNVRRVVVVTWTHPSGVRGRAVLPLVPERKEE